jgi:hypothetical protein
MIPDKNLKAAVEWFSNFYVYYGARCKVCGDGLSDGVGCYTPENQRAHQAPPGKTRRFFYPACEKCFSSSAALEALEAQIFKSYSTEH